MTKFALALMSFLITSVGLSAPKTIELPKERTIEILGEIDGTVMQHANTLNKLSDSSKEPIYLLINSPGGYVYVSDIFIAAMKIAQSRGVEIRCVVGVLAASAAFDILSACNKRYVLRSTLLLFHAPWVTLMGGYNATSLGKIYRDLSKEEKQTIRRLLDVSGMKLKFFLYHFREETLFKGDDLVPAVRPGFLELVDDVTGTNNLFVINASDASTESAKRLLRRAGLLK